MSESARAGDQLLTMAVPNELVRRAMTHTKASSIPAIDGAAGASSR